VKEQMTRKTRPPQHDPQAQREAAKYARPIASRELILEVLAKSDRPLDSAGVAAALGLRESVDLDALLRRLKAMLRDGQLVENRRGELVVPAKVGVVAGTVTAHKDGFGFLIPDDGSADVFLSPRQMRGLMHGDRVTARIQGMDFKGRPEGSIVDVLERKTHRLVGRYAREHGVNLVVPDNPRYTQDVVVPDEGRGGATPGQIVLVEIVEQPTKSSPPIGRISKVIGDHRAAGIEVEIALNSHGIPHVFAPEVEAEVAPLAPEVTEAAKQGRVDLRAVPLVTIDGADARDFDDAVFAEPAGDGYRLLVAIADVSHYVAPGTALDTEARERGTSVYFPDWVVPMLPEALSNGLCSLNPHVDRLCLVCEMRVDARGEVTRSRFHSAVMNSKARLTYDQVGRFFSGDVTAWKELEPVAPQLEHLRGVYKLLLGARHRRGAIEFERPETKIQFGPGRRIERIVPVVRNDAHRMIEECMIAANVEAARFLKKRKLPTLYRVHDQPDPEKITKLREFLGPTGLKLGGGDAPAPKDLAALISKAGERPDRFLIEMVMLRSMAQAMYQPEDVGHYGLALSTYAHFTSPIRRYPDLMVHRAIRHALEGGTPEDFRWSRRDVEQLGNHCSMTERRADEATRGAIAWLKCEYMVERVGDEFDGLVSAVVPFGFFAELDGLFVEGLVHVTSLPSDYWQHDAAGHRLVGERSGRAIRLADRVRVKVARVNLDERKIDFELVAHTPTTRGGPAGGRRKEAERGGKQEQRRQPTRPGPARTDGKRKGPVKPGSGNRKGKRR
jgi:ribonuclease R